MTRGIAVRIDGTGEEGHVVATRRTGDIVVDTGTYEVLLGPDAVTPIFGGGQLQDCPSCDGRGTTDGVGTCDRCGGTCTVVARPRGTGKASTHDGDTSGPAVRRAEEHVHNTVRRFHGAAAPHAG